jgi:hypothetical protein
MIINGANSIGAPANLNPIVCLSRDAFAIMTSALRGEDISGSEAQLPIIAGSTYEAGRIICFAQVDFFDNTIFQTADTATLLNGALTWVGGARSVITICLLGFPTPLAEDIRDRIASDKFVAEIANLGTDISPYKVAIIPSDIDLSNPSTFSKLLDFVSAGGGLAVFYHHADDTEPFINRLLIKFGVSYTFILLNEEADTPELLSVPASFTFVRDSNLSVSATRFKAIFKQKAIDTAVLDELTTMLRYHVMACDDTFCDLLMEIADCAWEFLRQTNYCSPEGFCPEVNQSILIVLLQDLYAKVPIARMGAVPEHTVFPGPTGDIELHEVTVYATIKHDEWATTGLWLPPGVQGSVACETGEKKVMLQVGAHVESLLGQAPPWRRWPWVITDFTLVPPTTEIGTPFGGIVYVVASAAGAEAGPLEVKLVFRNVCQFPRWVAGSPEIWEKTKDIPVPWGEIDFGSIIFTLPTAHMRQIRDFQSIREKYEVVVNRVCQWMSYKPNKPYRIVFDIELPEDGPGFAYPSVLLVDAIPGILLAIEDPALDLFKAISLMAINSIREDCFDVVLETAIASMCAAVVFTDLYPAFDPFNFQDLSVPDLFAELWKIHQQVDAKLIPACLAKFQDPAYVVPEDQNQSWSDLLSEMSRIGNRNFTPLFQRLLPPGYEPPSEIVAFPVFS